MKSLSSQKNTLVPVTIIFLYSSLLILTILFMINDGWLDKQITSYFYNGALPLGERFYLEQIYPWKWMNDNEIVFDATMLGFFIILLFVGLFRAKYPKGKLLTRYSLYILISVAVSVGLIVNVIFKGLYGRPRPIQTDIWPNSLSADNFDFFFVWEPAFLINASLIGAGKSFPSGHASATAMFSVLFYVFRSNKVWNCMVPQNPKLNRAIFITTRIYKWFGLTVGTIGTVFMGISRIVAGKHFASDVLWAIAIVWTISWVFYKYLFKIPLKESILLS